MSLDLLTSLSDNIVVDTDKCIYCGVCVEKCILDNLRLKLATCRQACPLELNCQGYVQLIARGQDEEAMAVVREKLPFPGILGRVCSQPCEDGCGHQETDGDALAIRALKRYLDDRFQGQEAPLPKIKTSSGKKVAVVGSGPAGLLAAHDLAIEGHQVTVFESESAPGGMMRWAIPEFRLPADVLDRELKLLERMGIDFQCGVKIGQNQSLSELENKFDAIVLTVGRPGYLELNVKGEDHPQILHGLPFLKAAREGNPPKLGPKVIVIGGGNTAVDVAQTACRLGGESVKMVSLESRNQMPAFAKAIAEALADDVILDGSWGNPTLTFEGDRLTGADFQKCTSVFSATGQFAPEFDSSVTQFLEADHIIVAIGQQLDQSLFGTELRIEDALQADPDTLQTKTEKIFVAGDLIDGPSSVVQAMASGRKAAESVKRFLNQEPLRYGRSTRAGVVTDFEVDKSFGTTEKRMTLPHYRFQGKNDFAEIETGVSQDAARNEASRCHSCGLPYGKFRTCWFCLPCEVECPTDAIWVEIPYLLR